jgi:hypothetical protein
LTSKEKEIILKSYADLYFAEKVLQFDKSETLYTLRFLLDNLQLKKDRYMVENEIISQRNNLAGTQKEMYLMIFETFAKYGRYINYDILEIESVYDDLQYEITDEEKRCHNARIEYIK